MTRTSGRENKLGATGKEPNAAPAPAEATRPIEIPASLNVKELAELLQVSAIEIIKQLMRNGIMANITQSIDYEAAAKVAVALDFEPHPKAQAVSKSASVIREIKKQQHLAVGKEASGLKPRPPVITVMGHVDHGKTKLLDAIRKTNVVATEAGGITQHIGAYQIEINGQKITFLDTPGHEAFTAMRARGAQVTDIAVLVVAADDGVMPQTIEAINHARAAGVPIVVAINKIDKDDANPDRVKQQLAEVGLVAEDWGGDTIAVPVSARENQGIPQLLENLLLVAEMEELRADPNKPAVGTVVEAEMDKTKGPLATVLIHDGTLRVGDIIVVGDTWGKLKAMFGSDGKQIRRAGPATPAVVLGLGSVPQVGDTLTVVTGEAQAKSLIERRHAETQQAMAKPKPVTLTNLLEQVNTGQVKELNVVLKTDVQGSIEPIRNSLEQLSTDEIKVRVIHSGSGNIAESDILLAIASKAIVVGFSTNAELGAKRLADLEGISIRYYNVIYNLVDDVGKALKGMLKPAKVEVVQGHAEVRAVFPALKKAKAAGIYVTDGKASRDDSVRVLRLKKVVVDAPIIGLRRFKDDVKEVLTGYEAGVVLKDFNDFQVGDILEFYRIEETV
ncbi:MAG: translation initiation factor IF-2 [Chloroflexota bacterium]